MTGRTNLPIIELAAGDATPDAAGANPDTAYGHYIDCTEIALERLMLRVTQTDASAQSVSVLAGDVATEAQMGALTKSIEQDETWWIRLLPSARFIRRDGTVHVDVSSGFAGKLTVFATPRS